MGKFIAVIHGWHVHSEGFTTHEFEAADLRSAKEKAAYLKDERQRPFCECAVHVIELSPSEFISKPLKLSLYERLTGVVKP